MPTVTSLMSGMYANTCDLIQRMFFSYYSNCFHEISIPHSFEKREFAVFLLRNKIMVRHKSFAAVEELKDFLSGEVPSDVYYSGAYYQQPDAPEMTAKGWIGADLVFDIDADHIPTSCDKVHDEWTCGKCGIKGRGELPEKCPSCGGEKFDNTTWPCELCLASSKLETTRLLDVLMRDFGFSEKEVHLFFSGHRGYHVHVEGEAVGSLDATARKEIVDYVCGLGFDAALHGLDDKSPGTLALKDVGWRGRIARGINNIVLNAKTEDYEKMGLTKNVAEAMMKNKDTILKNLNESKPLGMPRGVGPQTYRKLSEYSRKSQSAKVDTVVTTDIHRLIRLPGTLHGKTGLKKTEFPIAALDDFDPFKNALAFRGGCTTVLVSKAPEFRLGDEEFGPYRNERVELPNAAALLLICKKRAEVIVQDV
ncbi:MAG: DNA primase small subunit PriS [Candidatus Bathyarchaeia archaeon]